MTLQEKQFYFPRLLVKLLQYAWSEGYEVTWGEAYRTPEQAAWNAQHGTGIKNSLHTKRLAVDLCLFRKDLDGNWEYQTKTGEYELLGQYWESLDPLCRWGGHFGDGNHFSLEHEGVK